MKDNKRNQWENSLPNRWVQNHGKNHLIDLVDLNYHLDIYRKAQKTSFKVATVVAILTVAFFGAWITSMPEQLTFKSGLAMLFLAVGLWVTARLWTKAQTHNSNLDSFNSVEKFLKDMRDYELLKSKSWQTEDHLHKLGFSIAASDRLHGPKSLNSRLLRKEFKRVNQILVSFGLASSDWGYYIPKPIESVTAVMEVDNWPS